MMTPSDPIPSGRLAQIACLLEATARKPGNVHRFADFDDASYVDFLVSSAALGDRLTPEAIARDGLGVAIREAVRATRQLVGHNTNLGMILLLAPLVAVPAGEPLRAELSRILKTTTVADARAVYEAIRLALPGGLGRAPEQDIADQPTETLVEVMRRAADRDRIARQYSTDFADLFDIALPELTVRLAAGQPLETAIIGLHLALLARFPDSLIARKVGLEVAAEASRRAQAVLEAGWPAAHGAPAALAALDAWLRADGRRRNPGTTADLVCATLYLALHTGAIELPIAWGSTGSRPHG